MTDADDFLAHYGIKGMKWGHHKSQTTTSGEPKQSRRQRRAANNSAIREARSRQSGRARAYEEAQAEFFVARTNKGQAKAEEIMRRMEKDFFTHPDATTAAKLTSGEKLATGLAYGSIGLTIVGMIARSAAR